MGSFDNSCTLTPWHRFCAGDREAFAEFANKNYAPLYHYGTRFTPDKGLIQDCLQDLFLEIWEKREDLHRITAIKPYLFQSLRNNLIRRLRKQSLFSDILDYDDIFFNNSSPESELIVSETDQLIHFKLRKAIELLPKRQREALYLRYYENLTYEEIAQVMGLQRQAVANYLQYGIQKLREHWHQLATLALLIRFYP